MTKIYKNSETTLKDQIKESLKLKRDPRYRLMAWITKEVKELYDEKYRTLKKEIEDFRR